MPAPIIFRDLSGIAEGISGAGSALAKALGQRFESQRQTEKQKNYNTILGETLGSIDENSTSMDFMRQAKSAINQGVPVDEVMKTWKLYEPLMKSKLESETDSTLLQSLGLENIGGNQFNSMQVANAESVPQDQVTQIAFQGGEIMPGTNQSQENASKLNELSQDDLIKLQASRNPRLRNIGNAVQKNQEQENKRFIEDRKFHTGKTKAYETRISNLRSSMPKKSLALRTAREAVESGEVGPISWANVAERLNMKELQNVSGAALNVAIKENLFSNIGRVSARAQNQWLEKMMTTAFAQTGQGKEANLASLILLEGENEIDELLIKNYDKLVSDDIKKYGYVKEDIEKRVDNLIKNDYEDILNKVSFRGRINFENEKSFEQLNKIADKKVASGVYLTPKMQKVMMKKFKLDPKQALERAKKLNYSIPTLQESERWL